MAGLAKPNKIIASIGRFSAAEKPKWFDVVNGQARAHALPTIGAISALIPYNSRAGNKPTPAAIGSRAANPIGCSFTFRLGLTRARGRAEFCNTILTRQPRLLIKARAAISACQRNSILPPDVGTTPDIFGPKRICWALTSAKLIADKVVFCSSIKKRLCLPARSAGRAAKPRFLGAVRFNLKRRLADFTGFFNHARNISRRAFIGKRTTLVACKRVQAAYDQPDLFVAPPTPATQDGFDI
jgi:hypothetical protein